MSIKEQPDKNHTHKFAHTTQDTRRDFSTSQISLAYESQDGLCIHCGAGLEQTGYHAHHKDGDHSNNTQENLELWCPKSHFTTFKGSNPWVEHKKTEAKILESLVTVITNTLDPASKMSGATLEKLNDAMTLALKVSRNVFEIDYGRIQVPAELRIKRKLLENDIMADSFMSGYMEGVKATVSKLGVKTD